MSTTTKPSPTEPTWTAVDFLTGEALSETTTKRRAANQARKNHPGRGFGVTALNPTFVRMRKQVVNAAVKSNKPWAKKVLNRRARAAALGL